MSHNTSNLTLSSSNNSGNRQNTFILAETRLVHGFQRLYPKSVYIVEDKVEISCYQLFLVEQWWVFVQTINIYIIIHSGFLIEIDFVKLYSDIPEKKMIRYSKYLGVIFPVNFSGYSFMLQIHRRRSAHGMESNFAAV